MEQGRAEGRAELAAGLLSLGLRLEVEGCLNCWGRRGGECQQEGCCRGVAPAESSVWRGRV